MSSQKKCEVRVEKKGSDFAHTYEVPADLTDNQKKAYAKKLHKERSKKRPYGMKYLIQ